MTIGQAAARFGIAPSAIRFYEKMGLLPEPVRSSGRRVYDEQTLDHIAFVRYARGAGFTIEEIRALTRPAKTPHALSPRLRSLAAVKIQEMEKTIAQAKEMKKLLEMALSCRCLDPAECGRRIRMVKKRDIQDSRRRP